MLEATSHTSEQEHTPDTPQDHAEELHLQDLQASEPIPGEAVHSEGEEDKPQGHPLSIEDFVRKFEQAVNPEEKLRLTIQYMQATLSQAGTPFFKGFWEARQRCIPLFKDALPAQVRTDLWNEYRELCQESRRLKTLLDEQSAFAAEQIEIAIQALEKDLEQFQDQLQKAPHIMFSPPPEALKNNYDSYNLLQNELNLLNTHAARINALRKELIKTDMRIKVKNKFFKQLSAAGDHVFPRRKELIKILSTQFLDDVEAFSRSQFSQQPPQNHLFFLRDEIKALQAAAKLLTLNTYCFTQTRTRLSECWDKIKELDKERKKIRSEMRTESKQNAERIEQAIAEFRQAIANGEVKTSELNAKVDELFQLMQSVSLAKEDRFALKEMIFEARQPLLDILRKEEEARLQKEHESELARQEKLKELEGSVKQLLQNAEAKTVEELINEKNALLEAIQTSPLHKIEKQGLEKSLKSLKDTITEKKEKALLNLPKDELESLGKLREVLQQRRDRRKEIKERLEEYRKASSSSGLDFEKAIAYNELLQAEKERLEKIDQGIQEIEEMIFELESKA